MITGHGDPTAPILTTGHAVTRVDDDLPQVVADTVTHLLDKPRARGWIHLFSAAIAVLAGAAVAFAVMCAAVVVLTQTSPATMKADAPSAEAEVLSEQGEGTR